MTRPELPLEGRLSTGARFALAGVVALTLYAHWFLSANLGGLRVFGKDIFGFVGRQIAGKPQVLIDVGGQLLFVLLLYGLWFWLVAILARPRGPAVRWFEKGAASVLLTWSACSWLLLYAHNSVFPRSVWAMFVDPKAGFGSGALGTLVAGAWVGWRAYAWLASLLRNPGGRKRLWVATGVAGTGLAAIAIGLLLHSLPSDSHASDGKPNVIVIGLDSFRRDLALTATRGELPHIAAFREEAFVQENVISPLARTYPAWVTILTGQHPRATGARDNLVSQESLAAASTIATEFREADYRTLYATDETRFSNIGKRFGFDEILSPRPGVADFLLGEYVDSPLVNLAIQVPYSEWFLPSLAANRAFPHAYWPRRFINRVRTGLGPRRDRPIFLAVHLCLSHWPYYIAPIVALPPGEDARYVYSVQAVDRQFGDLLEMLRKLGHLDEKTIVAVLADHGEGLDGDVRRRPEIRNMGAAAQVGVKAVGHGGTLMVPAQWQVFTMFAGPSVPQGRSDQVASLEDVGPALLELAGLPSSAEYRLDVVRRSVGDHLPDKPRRSYVSMETGFRPVELDLGNPDRSKALEIGRTMFDVTADSRLELKAKYYAESIATRDMAVTDGRHALIALAQGETPVMVSADFDANRWDFFPTQAIPPSVTEKPLMLAQACDDPEMRKRMGDWCTEQPRFSSENVR